MALHKQWSKLTPAEKAFLVAIAAGNPITAPKIPLIRTKDSF